MGIDDVKFGEQGLVTTIAQDYKSGQVLMVAYMNAESLRRTLETGKMTYWSRSRQEFWVKGKSSGNFQWVKELRIDCDGDALLFSVEQEGGACHTGYRSCFHRKYEQGKWCVDGEKVFNPACTYA